MKITKPTLSLTARERITRVWAFIRVFTLRLLPVLVLAFLFAQTAILIDQNKYRTADASEFLKYTDFNVQNARENEDVYFKVCRDRVSNIAYDGDLSIYIIANADKDNEQRIQVYSRDIGGTIQNECENKVIRAADFKHAVGTYEMGFCVRFTVKYGFEKEVCKTSNRYRIYNQPSDLESKIRDLELQLETAREQLGATNGNINGVQQNSLAVPQSNTRNNATPSNNTGNNQSEGNTGSTGNGEGGGNQGTGVQPPTCSINLILGIGVGCGSDGLIRLWYNVCKQSFHYLIVVSASKTEKKYRGTKQRTKRIIW